MPRLKTIFFTLFLVAIIGIGMPLVVAESNAITILSPEIIADKTLVDVGEEVTFTAIGNYGDEVELIWVFHDGSEPNRTIAGEPGGLELTHVFPTEGVFLVSLFANAPGWSPLPGTIEIQVLNYRPSAYIEGPTEAIEDSLVTFHGDSSTDTPSDITTLAYYWTLGDGNTADSEIIEHSWSEAGEYPITLYVIDDQGALDMNTVFLTILNCPPLATFTTDGIIEDDTILVMEDEALLFDALSSWDTPTDLEELRYYWGFGDGTVANDPVISHTYRQSGTYEVTLLVMDDDGEQSEASALVQVTNYDPSVDITMDEVILHEGETYVFVADSWDSPSDYPILNYNWEFGESGWRASNFWMDDWSGDIQLIVEDDDGVTASDSVHVTVLNQPPHVWIEKATVTCNISLRIYGNKWQTLNLSIGHDGQVVQFDSLSYQLSDPPGLGPPTEIPPIVEYNITNFIFNLDYLWEICLDYVSEVKAGNTYVWLTLAFANGYDIDIHITFKNQDPDTWQRCLHPNYFFGHAPIDILVAMFDPGGDPFLLEVTGGVDSHDTILHQRYYPAVYPAYQTQTLILTPVEYWPQHLHNVESLSKILFKLKKQDYTFGLQLEVHDFDGGHVSTEVTFLLTYDYGLLFQGGGPTTQIIALPSSTIEDEPIEFHAVTTYPSLYDDTPSYIWFFGDGTSSSGQPVSHTYTNKGTYLIRLHVTDSTSTKVYHRILEVINPEPRSQSTQTHFEVNQDDVISFDATESSDTESDNNQLRFFWEFGDGATSSDTETSHAYAHDGLYTITLQVLDDNGAKAIETLQVTVLNQPPQILGPIAFSAAEGEVMPIEVAVRDSITDEPRLEFSWEINGDIITNKRIAIWKDDGTYTSQLTVGDLEGELASASIQIAVDNIKPEVVLSPVNAYGILQPILFQAYAIDAFTDFDDLNFEWYVNGEYPSGVSHSPWSTLLNEFEYSGEYLITVEVEDETHQKDSLEFISSIVWDQDGDGVPDEEDTGDDFDGDGLTDYDEINIYNTNPELLDTDGDGLEDGTEVFGWTINITTAEGQREKFVNSNPLLTDTDADNLLDNEEYQFGFNPQRIDTDGDRIDDFTENVTLGTNPANYDTDGDRLEDGEEIQEYHYTVTIDGQRIERNTESDPLNFDTDKDGLSDFEERYAGDDGYITDALLNDTDSDLALDAGESFSQNFELGKRAGITSNQDFDLHVGSLGRVRNLIITVGFVNISATTLEFNIFKPYGESLVSQVVDTSVIIFYRTYDLTGVSIEFSGLWTLSVEVNGEAVLDEYSMRVTQDVHPLVDDTDGDGLLDGEELYGRWLTHPLQSDTDQDGWDDAYEITMGTNPLSVDTDGDGVADPFDLAPTRNIMVKVTLLRAHYGLIQPIWPFLVPLFTPALQVVLAMPGVHTYVSATRFCTQHQQWWGAFTTAVYNYAYYYDIPDNIETSSLRVQLIHDGLHLLWDTLLLDKWTSYTIGSTYDTIVRGPPTWPTGDYFWVTLRFETYFKQRVNTIAIYNNASFSEGHYRGLDRYYTIILDISDIPDIESPFQQGINYVLIPRSIFQNTLLHQLLQTQQIPSYLQNAVFYGIDNSKTEITPFIEGTITASVGSQDALQLLTLLLKNSTAEVINLYYVTSNPEDLGLPQDVLNLIPVTGVINGPTGISPISFFDWLIGVTIGIVNAIAIGIILIGGALIALANFLLGFSTAVAECGMRVVATITEATIQIVANVIKLAIVAMGYAFSAIFRALFFANIVLLNFLLLLFNRSLHLQIEWNLINLIFDRYWITLHFNDITYDFFPWYRFEINVEYGASPSVNLFSLALGLQDSSNVLQIAQQFIEEIWTNFYDNWIPYIYTALSQTAAHILTDLIFDKFVEEYGPVYISIFAISILGALQIQIARFFQSITDYDSTITAAFSLIILGILRCGLVLYNYFKKQKEILEKIEEIRKLELPESAVAKYLKELALLPFKLAVKGAVAALNLILGFIFFTEYLHNRPIN